MFKRKQQKTTAATYQQAFDIAVCVRKNQSDRIYYDGVEHAAALAGAGKDGIALCDAIEQVFMRYEFIGEVEFAA